MKLRGYHKLMILFIPFLCTICPLVTQGFGRVGDWCATRRNSSSGDANGLFFLCILTVILLNSLYCLAVISARCRQLKTGDVSIYLNRAINGPVAYALLAVFVLFLLVLFHVIFETQNSDADVYVREAVILFLTPIQGIGNLIIFIMQKKTLKMLEAYMAGLEEFECEFNDDDVSPNRYNDVKVVPNHKGNVKGETSGLQVSLL
eukprot:CAMPEP_0185022806 /NCGR_PEP_ID=MMETSP1103-20130426/5507_1 /TAXON_ID=36769 /ORGANISM="Paraphysomonas bandaiensis, Strain Caron Lab Isolate" /LENGTH=203 /DNA_ID=CAMNT_0027555047 /DNA_START=340 /DNA_END=951 /DNA_ORIENTATION=-